LAEVRIAGKIEDLDGGAEARALAALRAMPDDYVVIWGYSCFTGVEEPLQLDAVVIGHHGIQVLEVKNWSKVIGGNQSRWLVNFHGQKIIRKSPLQQAWEGSVRLRDYLRGVPSRLVKKQEGDHKGDLRHWIGFYAVLAGDTSTQDVQDPRKLDKLLRLDDLESGRFEEVTRANAGHWAEPIDPITARALADILLPIGGLGAVPAPVSRISDSGGIRALGDRTEGREVDRIPTGLPNVAGSLPQIAIDLRGVLHALIHTYGVDAVMSAVQECLPVSA
jgi:hypothetical protein